LKKEQKEKRGKWRQNKSTYYERILKIRMISERDGEEIKDENAKKQGRQKGNK
jgi:hypothetical protein